MGGGGVASAAVGVALVAAGVAAHAAAPASVTTRSESTCAVEVQLIRAGEVCNVDLPCLLPLFVSHRVDGCRG